MHLIILFLFYVTSIRSLFPRADDEFILHTDASVLGIGAVLSVKRVGEEQPVAYFSKRTTSDERNYTISELECLAVVKAVDHFAIHLIGCKFTVPTDHRALLDLQDSTRLTGRLMWWALALQVFQFELKDRPGILHQKADGLSRQCWPEDEELMRSAEETPLSLLPVDVSLRDDKSILRGGPSAGGGGLAAQEGEMLRADPST